MSKQGRGHFKATITTIYCERISHVNHFSDTDSVLFVVKGSFSNYDSFKTHSTTNHFTSEDFLLITSIVNKTDVAFSI